MENTRPLKILYVEDDDFTRELINQILQDQGYEVILAHDGLSGIRLAQAEKPDLVLMDINMGDIDGYAVATRLRSLPDLAEIPIVALTGNVRSGDRERALTAGCDGYIAKPVEVREFPKQIAAYLSGQREHVPEAKRFKYLREHNHQLVERLESKVIELEKANKELKRANHALRRQDKMKSDFIDLVSHELRTPLSIINGYGHLLLSSPTYLETGKSELNSPREMIESILKATQDLDGLVEDLLNISAVELNKIELNLAYTSVHDVIQGALSDLSPLSQGRDLMIKLIELDQLPIIWADSQQLKQAFLNLISNAVKYTPDGGTIRIWGKSGQGVLELIVKDSGIGINPDDLAHIFDRFQVLGESLNHTTSKTSFMGGGLGLGLYIAKGIIEAHGGRIWATSTGYDPEKYPGTQFHILLPLMEN